MIWDGETPSQFRGRSSTAVSCAISDDVQRGATSESMHRVSNFVFILPVALRVVCG